MPSFPLSRRAACAALGSPLLAQSSRPAVPQESVRQHDESVARLLEVQTTDPAHPGRGGYPDEFGLHHPGSGAGCFQAFLAAWLCPQSRYHRDHALMPRLRLAAAFLDRCQLPSGNVDLLTTNFNSPPDTAFVTHGYGAAAHLARIHQHDEIYALAEPWLRRAGGAMAVGGVHTPNHRWVVCYALSQINELMPDPRFVRRIDQWLAEGIDIDPDGQYNERSTTVYNPITDQSLTIIAHKLNRPELLDPVRRNLDSMLLLLHPDGEVVTDISRRQDQYDRGTMDRYWFSLRYCALRFSDARYAAVLASIEPRAMSLPFLMEYPELLKPLPAPQPPAENWEHHFPSLQVMRYRRRSLSATLLLDGNSRFFSARRNGAVVQAVRFASAFFGKGQFIPREAARIEKGWRLSQSLEGPYYQPVEPPRRVSSEDYRLSVALRPRSEVCRITQSAAIREAANGFEIEMASEGTDRVPVAVEISLRPGGKLEGCEPAPRHPDAWILPSGRATYTAGQGRVTFGPGLAAHRWTLIRGAEPQLPGTSVYICGVTPFRHTLKVEFA